MEIRYPEFINVTSGSEIAAARRAIVGLSRFLGFDDEQQANLSIAITEAGTNLIKHTQGRGGEIIIFAKHELEAIGIEFIALDSGPGITNINLALTDWYSTAHTAGTGLGAIKRLMDEFYIYSYPDKGTVVMARMWLNKRPVLPEIEYSTIIRPKTYEDVSGDNWAIRLDTEPIRAIVVDGLGHGKYAAEAADKAVEFFLSYKAPLDKLMAILDINLRKTRGAVLSLVELFPEQEKINFLGVGNIFNRIITREDTSTLITLYGTVGYILPTLECRSYSWSSKALLIMHSDGIQTRWNLEDYPGLIDAHPSIIAAILYRDFNRGTDDTVVMVIRNNV